jgi:integrase
MARQLTGIQRWRNAWRAFVRVNGHLYTKTFDLSTAPETMRAWREEQRQRHGSPALPGGSFAERVQAYLAQNQSKAAINQATAHLELWLQALGRDRPPLSITKDDINGVIDDWLRTLAPGTVRKRRMWLRQFFVFVTGVDGGPCQKATNPKEPKAGARGIDYLVIEKALASMPARRSAKKGTVGSPSLALIRARVMVYTGLPPQVLMDVTADDLDFGAARLYVHGRDKGDGVEERELPLTPEAVAAFKAFHAANAYGRFAVSSLGRSVKAAFQRIGYTRPMRLYDLRHSYLTQVYRITRDTATVARLGMHAEGSPITARYTKGANQEVDEAAVAAFSEVLAARRRGALKAAVGVQKPVQKVTQKVTQIR